MQDIAKPPTTVKQLQEVVKYATITPSVNQIEFNPYLKEASAPLLAFMAERSITLEACSSLSVMDSLLVYLADSLFLSSPQMDLSLLCAFPGLWTPSSRPSPSRSTSRPASSSCAGRAQWAPCS